MAVFSGKVGGHFSSRFQVVHTGAAVVTSVASPCATLGTTNFGGTTGPVPCSLPPEFFRVTVFVK